MKLFEIVFLGLVTNGIFGAAGVEICRKPKRNRNSKMAAKLARANEVDSDALEKHAEVIQWENPTQESARFHAELGKMVSLHRVKDPFTYYQGYGLSNFVTFSINSILLQALPWLCNARQYSVACHRFFQFLCQTPKVPSPECRMFDRKEFQGSRSILNLHTNGRLGNQMSTFATLYAYAKALGLRPMLYRDQMDALSALFPRVREVMAVIEDSFCDPCDLPWQKLSTLLTSPLRRKQGSYERGNAFGLPSYHQNLSAYKQYLPAFREMFKIDDRFRTAALGKMADAAGAPVIGNGNLVLVGVHVRRTDFQSSVSQEGGRLATPDYFRKSMDWFQKNYATSDRRVMFIIISDDMDW